jgi:hypothetical protein
MGFCRLGKNVSILLADNVAEVIFAIGEFVVQNSKPFCAG